MNGTLGFMYRHALIYRNHLGLDEAEEKEALINYATGALSILTFGLAILLLFILPPSAAGLSAIPIILIGIVTRSIKRKNFPYQKFLPKAAADVPDE